MSEGQLRPGTVIDERFVLERRLGAGSTGVVWQARDQYGGRDVALKILHPKMGHDQMLIAQLGREANVLQQLDHPNIARSFAFQPEGPFVYLAMELVEGRTLNELMGEHTRSNTYFSHHQVIRMFEQLCSAVGYAHSKYIVHRDLKPHNVLVVGEGRDMSVKVLDFGIARLLEGSIFDATTLGRQLGSLFYMSPEQTRGEPADERSDVFALGTLLFELLTLRRAWAWDADDHPLPAFDRPVAHGENNAIAAVFTRLTAGKRPRVSEARLEIPPAFDAIVTRALAVDRDARHQSVADLAKEALDALRRITGSMEAPTELAAAVSLSFDASFPSELMSGEKSSARADTIASGQEHVQTALIDVADEPFLPGAIPDELLATAGDEDGSDAKTRPPSVTQVPPPKVRPPSVTVVPPPKKRSIPETLEYQAPSSPSLPAQVLEEPGPTDRSLRPTDEPRSIASLSFADTTAPPGAPSMASTTMPEGEPLGSSTMRVGMILGVGIASAAAAVLVGTLVLQPEAEVVGIPVPDARPVHSAPPPPPPRTPPMRYPELWSQLELVKTNPADKRSRQKMRDGIVDATRSIRDRDEAQSIVGCANGNAMMMNAQGLENCLLRLERASKP